MEKEKNFEFVCPRCKDRGIMHEYPVIDVQESPQLKDKILDGSLFSYTCRSCGYTTLVAYDCLYVDESQHLLIHLVEQGDNSTAEKAEAKYSGYTIRRVRDPNELMEKILIFDAGLDDRAVELQKHLLIDQIQKEKPDLKVHALYFSPEDDGYQFAVLSDQGFEGSIPMERNLYEQIRSQVLPELNETISKYPFINQGWAQLVFDGMENEKEE